MARGVYPRTEATKQAMRLSKLGAKNPAFGKSGPLSHSWKGGLSQTKEYRRSKQRQYRAERPEHYKEKQARWLQANYEHKLHLNNQRRVRLLKNGGSHTLEEWQEMKRLYKFRCPACLRVEPDIVLTRDHIIPLLLGGTDDISNIQPLCKSCNSSKSSNTQKYEI